MGYVLRISESNGYETPWHVLRLAGFEQGEMKGAGFPVAKLAGILGKSPKSLEGIAYQRMGDKPLFKILDQNLGRGLNFAPLRLHKPAICPHCVADTGYVDAFWDLSSAVACPKHHCHVLRSCPKCDTSLRWFRPGLLTCRCGADLTDVALPEVEPALAELMDVIYAKVRGQQLSSLRNTARLPLRHLEGFGLRALLWLLDNLGRINLLSKGLPAPNSGGEAAEAAVEVLAQWPTGFHKFLTELGTRNLSVSPSVAGFRKQFEQFYQVMFKGRSFTSVAGFLRDEFVAFGLNTWGNGVVDKRMLREALPATRRFIPKTVFARQHGIWKPSMDQMIADGTIVTKVITTARSKRTLIDLEHTHIPAESAGIVTVREAARHLGIPVSVLEGLRDSGIFETKLHVGRKTTWHVDDVEAFLTRGLALAKSDENAGTQDSIALGKVMRVNLRDAAAKTDIVSALFDGRIPVAGLKGSKLADLLVNKYIVDEFLLDKRRAIEGNTYSFPDAARITGLDPMLVGEAIQQGLIAAVERNGRRRVLAGAVEQFNTEYIVLRALASSLGPSVRHLKNVGQKVGISVIELRRANGGSQPVLARRDEPALRVAWQEEVARIASRASRKKQMADKCLAYEAALHQYLDDLRRTGKRLPRVSNRPNIVGIAKACNFGRDILYNFPTVVALLEAYDQEDWERLGGGHRTAHDAIKAYLDTLAAEGKPVPQSASGQVNKLAIAKACGINRNVLYSRPELMALLGSHPL